MRWVGGRWSSREKVTVGSRWIELESRSCGESIQPTVLRQVIAVVEKLFVGDESGPNDDGGRVLGAIEAFQQIGSCLDRPCWFKAQEFGGTQTTMLDVTCAT